MSMAPGQLPPYSPSPPPPLYRPVAPMLIRYPSEAESSYSVDFTDTYEPVTCDSCAQSSQATLEAWARLCCCTPQRGPCWLKELWDRLLASVTWG